jgi:lipase (class 3)
MINRQLEPVKPGLNITLAEILEAFAFTYLARYCMGSIAPRVNTAFVRAWKPDTIINIPRGDGGRPGGTVAIFSSESPPRMVVAIEGITSVNQLGSLMDGLTAVARTGSSGLVVSLFATWADSFYTALMAQPQIAQFISARSHMVTFTGHSAGAAMAEILAFKTKNLYPTRTNRLIKFGSPRVGTQRWLWDRPLSIKVANVYAERDPIHWLPWFGRAAISFNVANNIQPLTCYRREETPMRFTARQGILNRFLNESPLAHASHVSAWFGDPTANNFWPEHTLDAYRLTLMNFAAADPDVLQWRFNFLEHEDENSWQILFRPGIALGSMTKVVLDPAPDDAGPPSQAAVYQADTGVGSSVGDSWGGNADTDSGQWGGGNWEEPPVLITRSLPRRRVRVRL